MNQGEHVNKLRKHIYHADGGRFKVHTVMEQKIWMECNRLIANAIIYYNTWLLSELLTYHESQGNVIAADLAKPNREFFQHLFHLSVTKKLALDTEVPLLILRA